MIYDTPEQKNYLMECVRKYPCNYEQALSYANAFGQSIQDGRIVPIKDQIAKFPLPKGPVQVNKDLEAAAQLNAKIDGLKPVTLDSKDLKDVANNGKGGKKGKKAGAKR